MNRRRARVELLTSNLDTSVTFVPGFDLLTATKANPTEEEILAIALALNVLTGAEATVSEWGREQLHMHRGDH